MPQLQDWILEQVHQQANFSTAASWHTSMAIVIRMIALHGHGSLATLPRQAGVSNGSRESQCDELLSAQLHSAQCKSNIQSISMLRIEFDFKQ